MASGSIYQLLQSPDDQRAKRLQVRSLLDQQAMQGLQRQQLERDMADEMEVRSLAQQAGGDQGRLADLLTGRGLFKPAAAVRGQMTAAQKAAADVAETEAKTKKTQAETFAKNLTIARDLLAQVGDDQGFQVFRQVAGTLLPPQVAAGIPAAFDPAWRERTLMTADEALTRLRPNNQVVDLGGAKQVVDVNSPAARQPMPVTMTPAQQQAAINDPFLNQGGQAVPNKPVQDFQVARAAAGAARNNTNVINAGPRAFDVEIAKLDAQQLNDFREAAQKAQSALTTVEQIRAAEKLGTFSGGGAETKAAVGNLINGLTGVQVPGVVGSQQYNAAVSALIAERVKMLGANPSNADLEFIKRTVPQLATSPEARTALTNYMEAAARKQIDTYRRADAFARERRTLGGFDATAPVAAPPAAPAAPAAPRRVVDFNDLK